MILTPIVVGISDKIPPEFEEIFGYLTGRMFMVADKYKVFDFLFGGTDEKTTELLQQQPIFKLFSHTLATDLTLSICALTDPIESGPRGNKSENLVLKQLKKKLEETPNNPYQDLIRKLDEHYKTIEAKVESLRRWRNKQIAHIDYETVLKGKWNALSPISSDTFKEAILALEDYWNEFVTYFSKDALHLYFLMGPSGAKPYSLIEQLKKASAYEKLEDALYEFSINHLKDNPRLCFLMRPSGVNQEVLIEQLKKASTYDKLEKEGKLAPPYQDDVEN